MTELDLDVSLFKNITECDQVSSHSVHALVGGRRFRITAAKALHGTQHSHWALYEEEVPIETIGKDYTLWVRSREFPWAEGSTVNECLRSALHWVNDAAPLEVE